MCLRKKLRTACLELYRAKLDLLETNKNHIPPQVQCSGSVESTGFSQEKGKEPEYQSVCLFEA
jgi:hypothetical protein